MLIAICNNHQIENGNIDYDPDTTPRAKGTIAFYSCVSGYQLSGVGLRTCVDVRNGMGGVWIGLIPNCIGMKTSIAISIPYCMYISNDAAICDGITLAHGGINPTTTPRLEGSVGTHSCDEGYGLSPSVTTRICQPDRTWSGEEITCQRKYWVYHRCYINACIIQVSHALLSLMLQMGQSITPVVLLHHMTMKQQLRINATLDMC